MPKQNYLNIAKKSAQIQINELRKIRSIFNKKFSEAVELMYSTRGKIVCSGVGKSGIIARKISATLSSIGVPSFFLDSSNASHGDLGQLDKNDTLILFSYSGNTSELNSIIKYSNRFSIKTIGIASQKDSMIIRSCDIPLLLPRVKEADPIGMVPSSSTTMTLLVGDCLAVALMNKMKFSKDKFKIFHPKGSIGSALLQVKDLMFTGKRIPVTRPDQKIIQVVKIIKQKKLGMVVVQKNKKVLGFCSDGDVRRGLQYFKRNEKIDKILTKNPIFIKSNTLAAKAISLMNEKTITSLLVSDDKSKNKRLDGIVHIHSLLESGIK